MNRRGFISMLAGALPISLLSQTAVMKDEKALACSGSTTICPNKHKTCRNIDAPLVIGNENREYPSPSVLFDYRILSCSVCGVLFAEKV